MESREQALIATRDAASEQVQQLRTRLLAVIEESKQTLDLEKATAEGHIAELTAALTSTKAQLEESQKLLHQHMLNPEERGVALIGNMVRGDDDGFLPGSPSFSLLASSSPSVIVGGDSNFGR